MVSRRLPAGLLGLAALIGGVVGTPTPTAQPTLSPERTPPPSAAGCDAGENGPNCEYSDTNTCNDRGVATYTGDCSCLPGWSPAWSRCQFFDLPSPVPYHFLGDAAESYLSGVVTALPPLPPLPAHIVWGFPQMGGVASAAMALRVLVVNTGQY